LCILNENAVPAQVPEIIKTKLLVPPAIVELTYDFELDLLRTKNSELKKKEKRIKKVLVVGQIVLV
jgi:hypothetical protein